MAAIAFPQHYFKYGPLPLGWLILKTLSITDFFADVKWVELSHQFFYFHQNQKNLLCGASPVPKIWLNDILLSYCIASISGNFRRNFEKLVYHIERPANVSEFVCFVLICREEFFVVNSENHLQNQIFGLKSRVPKSRIAVGRCELKMQSTYVFCVSVHWT